MDFPAGSVCPVCRPRGVARRVRLACGACDARRYCSRRCSAMDWLVHGHETACTARDAHMGQPALPPYAPAAAARDADGDAFLLRLRRAIDTGRADVVPYQAPPHVWTWALPASERGEERLVAAPEPNVLQHRPCRVLAHAGVHVGDGRAYGLASMPRLEDAAYVLFGEHAVDDAAEGRRVFLGRSQLHAYGGPDDDGGDTLAEWAVDFGAAWAQLHYVYDCDGTDAAVVLGHGQGAAPKLWVTVDAARQRPPDGVDALAAGMMLLPLVPEAWDAPLSLFAAFARGYVQEARTHGQEELARQVMDELPDWSDHVY